MPPETSYIGPDGVALGVTTIWPKERDTVPLERDGSWQSGSRNSVLFRPTNSLISWTVVENQLDSALQYGGRRRQLQPPPRPASTKGQGSALT